MVSVQSFRDHKLRRGTPASAEGFLVECFGNLWGENPIFERKKRWRQVLDLLFTQVLELMVLEGVDGENWSVVGS